MKEKRLEITESGQFKALGHPVRWRLIRLLGERDATTTQLAAALERSKGSVGHHVKVLSDAGLIELSRTRQVGGATEKYWRRSAPGYESADGVRGTSMVLRAVLGELREEPHDDTDTVYLSRARIPGTVVAELKAEFERLSQRIDDARVASDEDGIDIGMLLGLYRPAGRPLATEDDDR